jgi:ABC-type bacteriocin/lantibiotic exporter with double-glycine peptidase domain
MLLDSPFQVLQREQAKKLVNCLLRRRGRATTVVVADDPQIVALADQVVVMREGSAVFSGSPSELVNRQSSPP